MIDARNNSVGYSCKWLQKLPKQSKKKSHILNYPHLLLDTYQEILINLFPNMTSFLLYFEFKFYHMSLKFSFSKKARFKYIFIIRITFYHYYNIYRKIKCMTFLHITYPCCQLHPYDLAKAESSLKHSSRPVQKC